jgi:hypothetical protein
MTRARDLAAFVSNADGDIKFDTDTLFIDSSANNVGIGTSSPAQTLHLKSADPVIRLEDSSPDGVYAQIDGAGGGLILSADGGAGSASSFIGFRVDGTALGNEASRIDSDGNLLVSRTSTSDTVVGGMIRADGFVQSTRDGGIAADFNRKSSDGDIVRFSKNSSSVGTIGSVGGDLFVGTGDTNLVFHNDIDSIFPAGTSGATRDNAIDMGQASNRFDDIFATNGTIQTSDENEKQQIAALTDAEMTAAKAISKLFKTFKWNDKVEAKGDAARTHTGVIAQQVETAMSDAGLDAGNYAFFISTTWWEADGDTYYTLEEAPEGATERNRKGIRYPELLSFIGAATEQRLTSIEARLDALEGA